MESGSKAGSVAVAIVLCSCAAVASAEQVSGSGRQKGGFQPSSFETASIRVEQNATDNDVEIVIVAKPDSDDGMVKFSVRAPDGSRVIAARSPASVAGMREYALESPEPADGAILPLYPEGEYTFFGQSTAGEIFLGVATLSHALPAPVTVLFPGADEVVPAGQLTIQWSQVPEAAQFLLEFENESMDPAQVMTVTFPGEVTSFDVPPALLVPGSDYVIGIASVAANGNVTFVESAFSIAE